MLVFLVNFTYLCFLSNNILFSFLNYFVLFILLNPKILVIRKGSRPDHFGLSGLYCIQSQSVPISYSSFELVNPIV
jgi:hypothetical protein